MNTIRSILLLTGLLLGMAGSLSAQVLPPTDSTEQEQVVVNHSDIGEYIQEGDRQIQMLMKKDRQVELRQGDVFMYCDTAIIEENDVVAYGNVIIQQGDSLNVFADSVVYLGNTRIADLFGGVVLETNEQKLFTEELNYNLNTKVATYYTGAMLTNEQTQLTSKRGYYYVDEDVAFFKDSVVVIDEEFTLQADTLQFNTESKVATFLGPTLIRQDSAKIYCEDGFYDTANKKAEFRENAQYVKGEQKATALLIRYDGDSEQVILEGDAQFVDGEKNATANTIRYDDKNDLTFLEGNAVYKDENQLLESDFIRYDAAKESFKTEGRSRIFDEAQVLEANNIDYDTGSNTGLATGNVYWVDTVEQITIRCENAFYDKTSDYLKATGGRPIMTTLVDGDTLYLAADTLISFRPNSTGATDSIAQDSLAQDSSIVLDSIPTIAPAEQPMLLDSLESISADSLVQLDSTTQKKDSTEARSLIAHKNVMIYKSNMQAICDSLTYSTNDSLFQFFKDPIIWSDTSQFSADVIHMQLANEKIDRIYLYKNAFIVNSPDEIFFNQVKGRNVTAFFIDNEIRRVQVDGNGEAVYYATDEAKAYVAVNKTVCSEMMLYFGNNEIEKIKFFRKPTAVMHPMQQVDHQSMELPGFYWERDKRPRSVQDLRKIPTAPEPELPLESDSREEEKEEEKSGE